MLRKGRAELVTPRKFCRASAPSSDGCSLAGLNLLSEATSGTLAVGCACSAYTPAASLIKVWQILPQRHSNTPETPAQDPPHVSRHARVSLVDAIIRGTACVEMLGRNAASQQVTVLQVVELLLGEGGADPDQADPQGYSPTHMAAQWGHVGVLTVLHDHQADFSMLTREGLSVRQIADEWSRKECSEMLQRLQLRCFRE